MNDEIVINRITETRRGRMALFAEDEFLFSVDAETCAHLGIEVGNHYTPAELQDIADQSETRKAKDKALRLLSQRAYGQQELYMRLCQNFDEHSAAAAVATMAELALLDDLAFATARAQGLAARRKSSLEIRRSLQQLGLDRDTVAAALETLHTSDADTAFELLCRQYLEKLRSGERAKVMAAMARRGFTHGVIVAALGRAEAEGLLAAADELHYE